MVVSTECNFPKAGDLFPLRQIEVHMSSLVLVSLPLDCSVRDSTSVKDSETLSGAAQQDPIVLQVLQTEAVGTWPGQKSLQTQKHRFIEPMSYR